MTKNEALLNMGLITSFCKDCKEAKECKKLCLLEESRLTVLVMTNVGESFIKETYNAANV